MTDSEVRLFTLERANSALPLVRRIMDDILAEHPLWKDLVARYEIVAAGARPESGESEESRSLRRQIDALAARINGYLAELGQIGCLVKDLELGLVDFYALYQGRLVLLCWRSGETTISHWHERDAGFEGRQDVTPEFAAAIRAIPAPTGSA